MSSHWFGKRVRTLHDRNGAHEFTLGDWPVRPEGVTDGEQLVQAFEYVAVLRLGPAARAWNHWRIAARLGQGLHEAIARQLAGAYEHARYAPFAAVSEEELAAARQGLRILAEGTA
jgi:hypothetical protein